MEQWIMTLFILSGFLAVLSCVFMIGFFMGANEIQRVYTMHIYMALNNTSQNPHYRVGAMV